MQLLRIRFLATTAVVVLGGGLFLANNPQIREYLGSPAFAGQNHSGNNGKSNGNNGGWGGGSGNFGGNDGGSKGGWGGKGNSDKPCPPGSTPSPPTPPSPPGNPPQHSGGNAPPSDWVNCEGGYTRLLQVLARHYHMAPQEYTAWLKAQAGIPEWSNYLPPDVAYGAWKKAFPHWDGNMCGTWDPVPWVQKWIPHIKVTLSAPVFHSQVAANRKPFQLWMPKVSLGSLF